MPEKVALASRVVVALLTLVIGGLAAAAVVMGALAFVMLAFSGAWSGERRWFGRHGALVFNALASGVALLAVAVPALAVWLVRRARPQATRPSGLGAAWGVLVGLLPFLAGVLLLRFLTRSFLWRVSGWIGPTRCWVRARCSSRCCP
jgi:hypothetical protein